MSTGSFDALRPPDRELVADCVHCGFCLPACPTYQLWGEEMDSPRGRIWLMKLALDGEVALDEPFTRHIDACLGCMACVTACPSGVRYDRLIEDTRAQVERHVARTRRDRLLRAAVFTLFPRPRLLWAAAALARAVERTGLRRAARRAGLVDRLPARLRALEALMPSGLARPRRLPELISARGARRGRVALLAGCVQREFFAEVNVAAARVLAAEGYDVLVPRGQGCCGALELHAGRDEQARRRARRLVAALEASGADAVVVTAAGCGSAMKSYGELLADDPAWRERAARFAASVQDVTEFLGGVEPRAERHPLPVRVAYQDACHLRHAQRVQAEPRRLLTGIPGVQLVDLGEPDLCCGSAGVYNILEPEAGADLGRRKAQVVLDAAPDLVASANPGCLLQLRRHLQEAGAALPAMHPIEVLDASLRGALPPTRRTKERR